MFRLPYSLGPQVAPTAEALSSMAAGPFTPLKDIETKWQERDTAQLLRWRTHPISSNIDMPSHIGRGNGTLMYSCISNHIRIRLHLFSGIQTPLDRSTGNGLTKTHNIDLRHVHSSVHNRGADRHRGPYKQTQFDCMAHGAGPAPCSGA